MEIKEKMIECPYCGEMVEESEMRGCRHCEMEFCPDCIDTYYDDICVECVGDMMECEVCNKLFDDSRLEICGGCRNYICPHCLLECDECGDFYCENCIDDHREECDKN